VLPMESRPGHRDDVCGSLRLKIQLVDALSSTGATSMGLTLRQSCHAVLLDGHATAAKSSHLLSAQEIIFPPLHRAAYLNDTGAINSILSTPLKTPIDSWFAPISNWTPLHYAAYAGNVDVLLLLLPLIGKPVPGLLHAAAMVSVNLYYKTYITHTTNLVVVTKFIHTTNLACIDRHCVTFIQTNIDCVFFLCSGFP
jgi:hypothetical protein